MKVLLAPADDGLGVTALKRDGEREKELGEANGSESGGEMRLKTVANEREQLETAGVRATERLENEREEGGRGGSSSRGVVNGLAAGRGVSSRASRCAMGRSGVR